MASTLTSYDSSDEDYIDMDLFSCSANTSPPQSREFEFQLCFISKETTNSPADELFYKGKLLPLHLSPRLRMLQKLLIQSLKAKEAFEEEKTPSSTPLEESGNNISSSETCRVSCVLNTDDEYFFEWSTELSSFIRSNHPKKSWPKKLKLVKNSIIGHKLKAYLKSIFSKSDESSCVKAAACNVEPGNLSKINNSFGNIEKAAAYPSLATVMKGIEKEGIHEDNYVHRRSSFSGATKSKCPSSSNSSSGAASLSSSCSFNLNAFHEFHFRKRSSSATEIDGSIEAAIAHCKKSQAFFDSRNTSEFSSLPGIPASNYQHRLDVCSI